MQPTKEELEAIPSIWDGWEKQCYFDFGAGRNGPTCAQGWLGYGGHTAASVDGSYARVANYLRANYPIPDGVVTIKASGPAARRWPFGQSLDCSHDSAVIVYANNELKLTPGQFPTTSTA